MNLRNVGILPQHYTASQPRRPRTECSQEVWKDKRPLSVGAHAS